MEPDPAALVRAAREDDLELLPAMQIAAGAAFREIGMAAIADSAPLPGPALAAYQQAGRGVGGVLVGHVGHWAARQGMDMLTLTTFRAVPWNGPYYARLGFREMVPGEITAGLAAALADEAAHGIDPATRVCMCRAAG
jgi:hypothetical protein